VSVNQYVYNFDKTLERTAFFGTISGLFSCCHALIATIDNHVSADEKTGDNRFPLRRRKRVREERSNGTVVLALLSIQSFASITLFDDYRVFRLTILVYFC